MADGMQREAGDLRSELRSFIGRHTEKIFDWDAFPANRGYPLLARAQMRYVGAGGSPKVDDRSTLEPLHFTVSLIHQPVGHYAAAHSHEVVESFVVLDGVLTVGWSENGDTVEVKLGPKDLILNASGIAHGFRNDGVEPVLMSVMVGHGSPLPPQYHAHPKDIGDDAAIRFGTQPGRTFALWSDAKRPLQEKMARNVVRYHDRRPEWDSAGFARMVYVGHGGIEGGQNRIELITVPKGAGVRSYERSSEETYFLLSGCIAVGWEENGKIVEERLGPRDLVFNPAGRKHYFRNDGVEEAQFFMVVGASQAEDIALRAL